MSIYYYKTEQFLPISIQGSWDFFSSAKNLALITPPELQFNILTALDTTEIYEGMLIDYTVRPLFGILMRWQTEIATVLKPLSFTDKQRKGPYKLWEHTHTFTEMQGGVLIQDEVKYQLPFGIIGQLAHTILVRKKIENIFLYRKNILTKIFKQNGANN